MLNLGVIYLWFQLYHVEHRIISLATFVYPSAILSDQIPPKLNNYTRRFLFFSKSYPRWMTRCFLEFALAPLPRNENWDVGMHKGHRQGHTLGDSPLPVNVGPMLFFVGREPDAFLDSPSMSEEYWQESLDSPSDDIYIFIYIFSLPLGFPCGIMHLLGQVYGPGIGVYFRQAMGSLDGKLVSWTRILLSSFSRLGGGFKHLLFSSLPGEMIQLWLIFFKWVETTT